MCKSTEQKWNTLNEGKQEKNEIYDTQKRLCHNNPSRYCRCKAHRYWRQSVNTNLTDYNQLRDWQRRRKQNRTQPSCADSRRLLWTSDADLITWPRCHKPLIKEVPGAELYYLFLTWLDDLLSAGLSINDCLLSISAPDRGIVTSRALTWKWLAEEENLITRWTVWRPERLSQTPNTVCLGGERVDQIQNKTIRTDPVRPERLMLQNPGCSTSWRRRCPFLHRDWTWIPPFLTKTVSILRIQP